jgi:hypothetical protein
MGLLVEVGLEMEQREGQRWDGGGRTTRGGVGPEVEEQRTVALVQFWVKELGEWDPGRERRGHERGFYLRESESESTSETAAFSRCSGLFLDVCMC